MFLFQLLRLWNLRLGWQLQVTMLQHQILWVLINNNLNFISVARPFNPLPFKPAKSGLKWKRASCLTRPKAAVLYISGYGLSRPNTALTFPFVWGFYFGRKLGWILSKNRKLQHSNYSWIASTQNNTGFPDIESTGKP